MMPYFYLLLHTFICTSCSAILIDGRQPDSTDPSGPFLLDLPLAPGAVHQLTISLIPASAQFLLVQAHVQRENVSLSQLAPGGVPELVAGRHVGLVLRPATAETSATVTVTSQQPDNATVLLVVAVYGNNVPIPGGCSQTEPVAIAPFFRLESAHEAYTFFDLPRAQMGVSRNVRTTCNFARTFMSYHVYLMYSAYHLRTDYGRFREAISLMLKPASLQANAIAVAGRELAHPMVYTFAQYRGYTAVYGVSVSTPAGPDSVAAYVPAVHHGCPVFELHGDPECWAQMPAQMYVVAVLLILAGLTLLTVAASRLVLQVLLTTTVLVAGLSALLLRALVWDQPDAALGLGLLLGAACALWYARQWTFGLWTRGYMMISMAALFGLSVGAVFFFTPAVRILDMVSDLVFWPAFLLVTSVLAFCVLLPNADTGVVLIRSVLGSLWIAVGVSIVIRSVIVYIFINIFSRAVYPQFRFAIIQMAFFAQDYVVVVLFGLLLLTSVGVSCVRRQHVPFTNQRHVRLPFLYPPAGRPGGERDPLLPAEAGRHRRPAGYGAAASA